ncbi:MAG: LL-diaminopimelate aminotransferase [Deltaproteobacteria bacterium]|nr:LL-diaminopimelate aminotransferase [Deltaproteobacteria bacterium]
MPAARIRELPPYLFARIDDIKQEALAAGIDVIDLGIGDPDLSPPEPVIDALIRGVRKDGAHHYSSYAGLPRLRRAFSEWFEHRFGVPVDPDREVLPLIGSKEGIGHIYLSQVDPGDEVLIPDPGYPVYAAGAVLAGAIPRYFPLRRENSYLPAVADLEGMVSPRTRMMWLNYPSNPTAVLADRTSFEEAARFARDRGLLICHDMAYSEITFDGARSVSFLEIDGGKDVCVEFHSLSKTFCMPGWRVGFAVGNAGAIGALAKVKTNLDSGIFIPLQEAAVTALEECGDDVLRIGAVFEKRRNLFVSGLAGAGWDVPLPPSTFYVWAPIPAGYDSMGFCTHLLREAGIVCTPGTGFGKQGEGFVRMSLTVPDERLEEAVARLRGIGIVYKEQEVLRVL